MNGRLRIESAKCVKCGAECRQPKYCEATVFMGIHVDERLWYRCACGYGWTTPCADALIASAGEQDDPALREDGAVPRLTREQAVIVSAYTGYLVCDFADMHKAIERKLARPVFTHELGIAEMSDEIRCAFKSDFLALAPVKGGE